MENFEGILAQMTEIMWTGCSVRFDPDMVEIKDEEMLFQCERMIGSGNEGDFVAGNL